MSDLSLPFYIGIDGKTKFAPEKKTLRAFSAPLSPTRSSPQRHFVHIRDFAFEPCMLNVEEGDTIVFHNDNHYLLASTEVHALCLHRGLPISSPLLRQGERWEYICTTSAEDRNRKITGGTSIGAASPRIPNDIIVRDCIFPFMNMKIHVRHRHDAVVNQTSVRDEGYFASDENRYADAFVYAAANNQLSIVRRRLGLPEEGEPLGPVEHAIGSADQSGPPSFADGGTFADSASAPESSAPTPLAERKKKKQSGWNWRAGLGAAPGSGGAGGGGEAVVEYKLPVVAHVDVRNSEGITALMAASKAGHLGVMEVLLDCGADVNAKNLTAGSYDGGGDTSLHVAAKWGKHDAARLLLTHHQRRQRQGQAQGSGSSGSSSGDSGGSEGRPARVASRANIHARNDLRRTPLHLASLNGHLDTVRVLLEVGEPDPTLGDYNGRSALELAVDFGRSRLEVADALAWYASHVYAPGVAAVLACADSLLRLAPNSSPAAADAAAPSPRHRPTAPSSEHVVPPPLPLQLPPMAWTRATRGAAARYRAEVLELVELMEEDGRASPEQASCLSKLVVGAKGSGSAAAASGGGEEEEEEEEDDVDSVLFEAHRVYTAVPPYSLPLLMSQLLARASAALKSDNDNGDENEGGEEGQSAKPAVEPIDAAAAAAAQRRAAVSPHPNAASPLAVSNRITGGRGRQQAGQQHQHQQQTTSAAPLSAPPPPSSPFRFISEVGVDALRLVLSFATAPQAQCLAELAVTRARAGAGGGSSAYRNAGTGASPFHATTTSRAQSSSSSSSPVLSAGGSGGGGGVRGGVERGGEERVEMFGPLRQFDPRTRSLPYLLRRSEEAAAAAAAAAASQRRQDMSEPKQGQKRT